ncbi:TetR/AcrR family transcriptional regulator [Azovibrio restrictus]|uniref:TetR/AcrR family transcriptional regulator n=1 Tax=Azovibrio restrictus TaxID=146938 RepID=UPI000A01D55B|nr:TetR/AcrR family transcriptional regulator [Azovibrio restrictus]
MSPLPSSPRRPGRPRSTDVDSREKLLAAALLAFSELGFAGASLRAIALSAGFDVAMIFHHFGSKERLWLAVGESIEADFQQSLNHELVPLMEGNHPIAERVTRVLDVLVEKLIERPAITMLIMREMPVPGERRDFLVTRLLRPSCDGLVPFWLKAMEAGVLRPSDPVLFHVGIFGAIAMVLAFHDVLPQLGSAEMDLAEVKAHLYRGLLADPA